MGMDHCLHYSCVSSILLTWQLLIHPLSIIGGALMSFLPTSNRSGILVGIYLVNAVVAPLTIFYNVSKTARNQHLLTHTSG
jgi:hypothetical protein